MTPNDTNILTAVRDLPIDKLEKLGEMLSTLRENKEETNQNP